MVCFVFHTKYEYSNCSHENSTNQVHPNEMCIVCMHKRWFYIVSIRFVCSMMCMNKIARITYKPSCDTHIFNAYLILRTYTYCFCILYCSLHYFHFYYFKINSVLYRYICYTVYDGCMVRAPHTAYTVYVLTCLSKAASSKEQDIFMCIIIITLHLTIPLIRSYGC